MTTTFVLETFGSLTVNWRTMQTGSRADFPFSLPEVQALCWRQFREPAGARLCLGTVKVDSDSVGIAPLAVLGNTATFLGVVDVCDYLDFIVQPGYELQFFSTVLRGLQDSGVRQLDLAPLRPDSTVLAFLADATSGTGWTGTCERLDVSVEVHLPLTWDSFIESLDGKQRHEVKRKLRRFEGGGATSYEVTDNGREGRLDEFLRLMRISRSDKATFMTQEMATYFRGLSEAMASRDMLSLAFLRMNGAPVAATMSFDYGDTRYLYNSGYDPQYARWNVGLVSKLLAIRDAIEKGRRVFDLLKGNEAYKYRLGGREVPLHHCRLTVA